MTHFSVICQPAIDITSLPQIILFHK